MYKISLGHAGSPYEWWPMPLDNSGTKMVLNRYGNLITTKDRTNVMQIVHNINAKTTCKHLRAPPDDAKPP